MVKTKIIIEFAYLLPSFHASYNGFIQEMVGNKTMPGIINAGTVFGVSQLLRQACVPVGVNSCQLTGYRKVAAILFISLHRKQKGPFLVDADTLSSAMEITVHPLVI